MKQSLQVILNVIRSILSYCTGAAQSPIVQSVPKFAASVVSLQAKETAINNLAAQQSADIKGFTTTRKLLRASLAIVSYSYLRRGMAYAKSINDDSLCQSFNYTLGRLKNMKFDTIGQVMNQCFNTMQALPADDLEPFGITSLVDWANAISAYNDYESTPRNQVAQKKALGEMLTGLVRDANTYLRTEVAFQAEAFVDTNPLFYLGFKANLKRDPAAPHHSRLIVSLKDELGEPCILATVTLNAFTKGGKSYQSESTLTDINGNCSISGFESGIRTVTVSGDNIETKTFGPFQFQRAKTVTKSFICTPAFQNIPAAPQQKETVSK